MCYSLGMDSSLDVHAAPAAPSAAETVNDALAELSTVAEQFILSYQGSGQTPAATYGAILKIPQIP